MASSPGWGPPAPPEPASFAAATPARAIDARSIVTLIVFFAVNALVIFPLRIPLPRAVGRVASTAHDAVLGLGRWDEGRASDGQGGSETSAGSGGKAAGAPAPSEPSEASAAHAPPPTLVPSHASAAVHAPGDAPAHPGAAFHPSAPDPNASPASGPPSRASTPAPAPAVPPASGRPHFTLGLATAPVAGVLLLLASTCIPGSVVRGGIVGGVRPYDIMTLFLSFAYISLSLDCTGLLRFLAFTVAARSSSSGKTLFFALYALFALLSLAVGNDPVVLSGTPFVAYFTTHTRVLPTPFLFAQFQAANLASALLVSSNPTNLVLTSSFHLSFLSFSAWTALPTVAAAVALYPVLALLYRKLIPASLDPPHVNPKDALVDPVGALFTSTVFIFAIIALVALSAAGMLEGVEGVWTVTAPAALLVLLRDAVHDLRKGRSGEAALRPEVEMERVGPARTSDDEAGGTGPAAGAANGANDTHAHSSTLEPRTSVRRRSSAATRPRPSPPSSKGTPSRSPSPAAPPPPSHPPRAPTHPVAWLRRTFPTVAAVVARLPLPLLPFAFSMFILVDALEHTGWVAVWARWWAAWARAGGTAGCIWLMGVVSVLGCNILGTNIGLTVLLSRILVVWRDAASPSNRTLYGSVLALAIGSNFGAYSFVFSASLAGLLWRDILAQKGLSVGRLEFMRWNMVPLWTTMAVACLVVAAEVCVMFKD